MADMVKNVGLYIHVPFCKKRCGYCDFFSGIYNKEQASRYMDMLCEEISRLGERLEGRVIDTVYFGGGTPSLLSGAEAERVLSTVKDSFATDFKEVTIEVNPDCSEHLEQYAEAGINRVSIGLQSLYQDILRKIGRNALDVQSNIEVLKRARGLFDSVSCDIMTGIDEKQDLISDLTAVLPYVDHISAYMLKVEQGTWLEDNNADLPDDDETTEQFFSMQKYLERVGFARYEISNFAPTGRESKHNLKYWQMKEYLGVGAAAHSYMDGRRYFNIKNTEEYIRGNNSGYGREICEREYSVADEKEETLMLGLRTSLGVDVEMYNERFGVDLVELLRKKPAYLRDFLKIEQGRMFIPARHMSVFNSIIMEIL